MRVADDEAKGDPSLIIFSLELIDVSHVHPLTLAPRPCLAFAPQNPNPRAPVLPLFAYISQQVPDIHSFATPQSTPDFKRGVRLVSRSPPSTGEDFVAAAKSLA